MTTIKLQNIFDTSNWVVVNGKKQFITRRITGVKKISSSEWEIETTGYKFTVYGGKKAGGGRNDWFLECSEWNRRLVEVGDSGEFVTKEQSNPIDCNSAVDAMRLIENC